MRQLLLAVVWLVVWAGQAVAAPSYCTLTGSLLLPNGDACANCNVTIRVPRAQEVGGVTFPVKTSSYTTDANGTLPAGVQAARTLVVEITIDKTPPLTVQIPNASSADLSTLLLPPITLPTSTNINSLSSILTVSKGGTGGAPSGDDQVLVSSSTSAASWKTLTDCNAAGEAVTYDTATNSWGCATGLGGGGGSGDVSSVGDCTTGACFDGTTGNALQFEGSTANGFETTLTATDPTADRTITMPNRSGQMALERTVNLYDYAACDGTNEATGIQAAITAACALGPGGTLYVPADTCVFASTLTLCSGLAIVGSDSTERVSYLTAQPHELSYSGTGAAIDAQSLSGVRLSGLLLRATSGSFAGPLVDADGTGYLYIDRVMMTAATQAGAATCALLSINDGTDISVTGSAFYRCGYAIKGRVLSSNFANVVKLDHNAFYEAEACSILNPGDAWSVTNNKWQQQGATDNESDMICHGAGICSEGIDFTGNMSVDQPSGPTNGQFIFCGSGIHVAGNFIGGGTTQDGVLFDEQCDGCSVQGNWFGFLDEGVKFSGTGSSASNGVVVVGNDYDTVTTKVGGTRPGGSVMQENTGGYIVNETGDIWLNADTDANSIAGAVVIGSNATSTSADPQYYFLEDSRAELRRGNDLRFYDSVANGNDHYVEMTLGTANIASDKTLTIPDATGTMCVSASPPLTLNATTGNLTTSADPVSIKGVAVTDTSGVDFVEGTGITITSNTGVSPDTATLAATLGTAIDSSEITDATIAQVDIDDTATLAGNPAFGDSSVWFATTGLIWEGATSNSNEGLLIAADVSADRTWTLPDESGTVCTTGSICSGTVTYQAGPLSGDVVTSGAVATIQANSVALTTDTTGNYAAGDAEAGNATGVACTDCVALTTETTGNYVATITGGAGIASTGAATGEGIGHTLSTASDEADFLKSGALTCGASTNGKMQVHTTPLQYCDNAGTPTLQYAAYGNSSGESTAAANNSVALTTDTTGDYVATITGGAGIASSGATSGEGIAHSLSTASNETDFLANGALTCGAGTRGRMQIHTTPLQYCDNAATPALQYAAYGNSSGESTAAANDSVALTTDTTGNYAAGDAEAGNATGVACTDCIALTTETTGNYVATITGGAGIASTGAATGEGIGHTLSTASDEADFLKSGALTCGASTQGKMQVHTTPLQYCDNAGTPTLQYAAYGNSSGESTAAANNSVAMGTDTTGDYVATITGGTGITSSGATSGESIAHSLSFDATEIDSPTWSNGGSASLTHTWNLSGTDPVLTLQSGAFNLTGNTLIGATGSGGSLTVNSTSNATKGSIILDDKVDLWPNIPDFSASAMEVMEFNSDLDLSGVGLFHSIFHLDPTIHIGQAGGFLGGIVAVSTEGMLIAHDDATAVSTNLPSPQLFWADHIIETTVAIAAPSDHVLLDQVEKRSTGAITVPTGGTHRTVWSAPKLKASTNATATYDEVSGLYWGPVAGTDFTTDGTALTVSEANAVKVENPTKDSGTGTTTYTEVNGLNCSNLTVATTNSCVKSAVTANSARYFLNDTGGAQSKLTGKFTTYNNVTTAGTGLPIITGESGVSATKTADFTALSYTPPATAGRYRVEQVITTTSGTNTGSFQCTVDYVDSQGTTHTADLMPMVNQTGLWATALPVVAGASKQWHCGPTYITINNSATAIVLKVDVTTGTVNYTVAASVEQLG